MLPVPPRLLVFDLDGTLIDSSLDLCNSVNAALTHVGRPNLPNAIIAGHIGDGAAMLVHRSLATHPGAPSSPTALPSAKVGPNDDPLFQQTFSFFLTYYRDHKLDHTRTYPGVLEALQTIRAHHPHLPMAVLTNKPVGPSRALCEALDLAPYFFQNYGGDSFPTKKPDPTGLLTLIAEASAFSAHPIAPAETVMLGDSDVDIHTARNAGARSLACTYGLAPHTLAAAAPDLTVDYPTDWPKALGL